ncbi:LrgB family protein [Paraburkholderia sp. CNPSo 3272]|nr:LrgB family protein [Paraburkholderia sp. CNPSo 3272]
MSARWTFDVLRLRMAMLRGFAVGLASYAIGAARAFQVSAERGTCSALVPNGVSTDCARFARPRILIA